MNKNKKYILIALLASLLFTVTIGFSMWIILSEQARGYIQSMGTLELKPNGPLYAGETWTYDGTDTSPNYATVTYKHYTSESAEAVPEALSGTFVVSKTEASGESDEVAADVKVTFFPSNLFIRWVWGEKIEFDESVSVDARPHAISGDIKLKAVAKYGNNYYTTIDAALVAVQLATSGTVYAIPTDFATETGRANIAKTITPVYNEQGEEGPREIPSGVTLCLPYDPTMTTLTSTQPLDKATRDFTSTYRNKSEYCTNVVTVNSALNIYGNVEICATLNAPNAYSITGTTHGQYALVKLGEKGFLDVYGEAIVLGYLEGRLDGKDQQSSYNAIEFHNGSTLQVSFSFYEFRAGTQTIHMVESVDKKLATMYCCPFYRYFLPNVVGGYTVHKTANMGGLVSLNINDTLIKPVIPMIGGTSSHFIQMTGTNAYAEVYYDPDERVTLGEGDSTYSDIYGTAYWSINGGAKVNMLALPISMSAFITIDMTVTSKDVYFPIPYGLEIEVANGTYDISTQDIKVHPGGRFVVGEGADVTARNIMVATTPPPVEGDVNTKQVPYPTATQLRAAGRPETGECIVQPGGKLTVTAGCGEFLAGGAGAILNVQGVSPTASLELYGASEGTGTVPKEGGYSIAFGVGITGTLYYVQHTATTFPFTIDKVSGGTYEGKGAYYSAQTAGADTTDTADDKYAWYSGNMTVTFMANGVAAKTVKPDSSYTGLVTPPTVTRNYYTFSHWCTSDGCTAGDSCANKTEIDFATQKFFTETIFFAAWTPNTYSIAFDANGGTFSDGATSQSFSTQHGAKYNLPPSNPTRIGYTFAGWESGGSAITADTTMATGAHTVTAKWTGNTYTVTLDAGDGTFEGGATTTTASVTFGNHYGTLATPTRDGYVFAGWQLGDTVIAADEIAATVVSTAGDHTLTAVWEALTNEIIVQFNVNGEEYELRFNVGATLPKSPQKMPAHHTFNGWSKVADGDILESTYTLAEADAKETGTVFYARLTLNKYTVTFDPCDGTVSPTSATEDYNTVITLPVPTRDGYWFNGWYTAKSGGTPIDDKYTITQDTTLYAQWSQNVTVGYNANGGTCGTASATYKGTALTLPTPTRTGYTFNGWYTAASGGTKIGDAGASYTPSANVTLYAQWQINSYTITVKTNNATVKVNGTTVSNNTTVSIPYGTEVTVEVTYSQSDDRSTTIKGTDGTTYTSPFNMPAQNVTINATSSSCIAAGTLITLADGTQKKVEDLTMDDLLLVFNHETGRYEAAAITFIENDGWDYYDVINLVFSDGTVTKLIYEHALFDLTLNKYVYITEQNYADFVGHEFAVQDGDTFGRVTLTEAFVEREYTGCYSLVTAYHLNYLIDGLFSIPGGIDGLFNIFEYGDDLKYDEEKMNADIEEFGLFTYEEFASYYPEIPVEVYEMFPAKYFKVSIGKGMLTFEDISSYIEQFLIKNGII